MNVPNKTTPAGKGLRTAAQAILGSLIGLVTAIWAVDGVPETVFNYLKDNWLIVAVAIGLPSGLLAWLQNRLGK